MNSYVGGWTRSEKFHEVAKELQEMGFRPGLPSDIDNHYFRRNDVVTLRNYDADGILGAYCPNPSEDVKKYIESIFTSRNNILSYSDIQDGMTISATADDDVLSKLKRIGFNIEGNALYSLNTKNTGTLTNDIIEIKYSNDGLLTKNQFSLAHLLLSGK